MHEVFVVCFRLEQGLLRSLRVLAREELGTKNVNTSRGQMICSPLNRNAFQQVDARKQDTSPVAPFQRGMRQYPAFLRDRRFWERPVQAVQRELRFATVELFFNVRCNVRHCWKAKPT